MADRGAFDDFFREGFARLTLFVIKLGASREEAEDAAQEAMTRAYLAWSSIDHPRAWVRVVAERIYLASTVRAKQEFDKVHEGRWTDDVCPQDNDPAIIDEEARLVHALLDRLPYWQRKVLAWHYDGFSTKEIAEATGKPPTTVRSHLRHARERLQQDLTTSATDPPPHTKRGIA